MSPGALVYMHRALLNFSITSREGTVNLLTWDALKPVLGQAQAVIGTLVTSAQTWALHSPDAQVAESFFTHLLERSRLSLVPLRSVLRRGELAGGRLPATPEAS